MYGKCFSPFSPFQVDCRWILPSYTASCHFGCFCSRKTPIFGPTLTWNDNWMGPKSIWHIFSYCLWCVLTLSPLSRLIILSIIASPHLGSFWTPKHPFLDPPGPGVAPGWGIKVSDRSLPIAWGVFWPFFLFPGWFFVNYGTLSFWLFLDPKAPIFGPAWTWNDTWMGHKSVQHTFSHCLGCVLAHFPVSRWITGLIWQPTAVVHFDPKNGCF